MERLGGWKRDFKVPQAILRWLGTMAVMVGYFCLTDQVVTLLSRWQRGRISVFGGPTMSVLLFMNILQNFPILRSSGISFSAYLNSASETKLVISWLIGIRRSTTLAFIVALVTTFFPKEMMVVPAWCYMLYLWGCPFCILLVLRFVLHEQETSLNNSQGRNEMDGRQGPNEMEPPSTSPKKEK